MLRSGFSSYSNEQALQRNQSFSRIILSNRGEKERRDRESHKQAGTVSLKALIATGVLLCLILHFFLVPNLLCMVFIHANPESSLPVDIFEFYLRSYEVKSYSDNNNLVLSHISNISLVEENNHLFKCQSYWIDYSKAQLYYVYAACGHSG